MGDKLRARELAATLGVPVIAGTRAALGSPSEAVAIAEAVGYPIVLKAAAGGGGRVDLAREFPRAQAEAQAAFGNGTLYAERFLERVRHVEVQILADGHGHCVHLGERDCSVQRRHQKLVEEAPSLALSAALREEMRAAAVAVARAVAYRSAGTVEFVVDPEQARHFFLEMNTRIQVEHPVTEAVTGRDLVVEQLRIAAGARLDFAQADVVFRGHAIECRINAEAADAGFRPSPGRITTWRPPTAAGVRVDTHCYEGYAVPPFYDSLLAKVIVHGRDRPAACRGMAEALDDFSIGGIETTLPFHRRLLADPRFLQGDVHTRWVEETFMAEVRA
jgi:acetyl-CoA carboxylase biotin carboxylase subunit